MIKKLKYNEVDWEKYHKCLENSEQFLFFAEKQYLDLIINTNWQVLVYGDYKAVMPVPMVKKLGFTFVLMPMQTQQLGVFSEIDHPEINNQFYLFLNQNYSVLYYAFNAQNTFSLPTETRKNFILEKDTYENVRKKYSVHRRRNVRVLESFKDKIHFEEATDIEESKVFFHENIIGFTDKKSMEKAFNNMKTLRQAKLLKIYNLLYNNALASQAYLLETHNEQFLINFINDKKYLKHNSTSIILDKIFQNNIEEKQFNFHGSNLSEIAEFYRRFGAKEEQYAFIKHNKKQLLTYILKKR